MPSLPPFRAVRGFFAPLALLALLAACGRKEPETPKAPPRAAALPGKLGTASVAGRVTLSGTPPANPTVSMSADPYCAGAHPGETEIPGFAVGPDRALANVLVHVVDGVSGTYPVPTEAGRLDQKGCAYVPRLLAIRAGQPLDIVSSDATLHNVHAAAKENPAFNLGMTAPGTRYTRTFERAEIVPFKCDVHPWMRAWVAVEPHPFFAVTGADGLFEIRSLPAGTYTIEAWHERLPALRFTVVVADGARQERDVEFPAASAGADAPAAPPLAAPPAARPSPARRSAPPVWER
jgi:plastocyanin